MSTRVALFCSEQALKAYTSVNENVSPKDLIPYILQAQDSELQYYLGSTFYFEFQNQILNNTVTEDNQFLLDNYISKALIQLGLMRAIPFLRYKIFNRSIVAPKSENADAVSLEEIQFLQQECRTTGNQYLERMVYWIQLHPEAYGTYFAQNVKDGNFPSQQNPMYGTLVAPTMPYAWKKRYGVSTNQTTFGNGFCPECLYPNTMGPGTIF
jgi:hypothetical protein